MSRLPLSPATRAYLERHGIDPDFAYAQGVRSNGDDPVYRYTRRDGSTFLRRRDLNDPNKRTFQPKGEPLIPYCPTGRPGPGETALILEGETDQLAAAQYLNGNGRAVGIPGTTMPVERIVAEVSLAGRVILGLDNDDAGRKATDEIARALQPMGIPVHLLGLPEDHDLSDVIVDQEDPAGWLAGAVEGARPVPKLKRKAESGGYRGKGSASEDMPSSSLIDFTEIVAKPVRWAWQDRIALSKITGGAGRPKIGKGLLYSLLIAEVTRGTLEGDLEGPREAIIVTTEDEPGDTLKPRLMAAGADLKKVSMFQMGTKDGPVPFRVPQDADELRRRVTERDAALVVIDPLLEFIDGKADTHKSQPVRQAVASLNQIARDSGCAVLVIFHLNKGVSTDPLLRHEGSAAFTQVVRGSLMLGHDPEDPDGEDGSQRVLAVSSSNLAAPAPSLVYQIDTAKVTGDTGEEITTARMALIGESDAGAHDLLRGRGDEEQVTAIEEAEHFLRVELADGPRPAREIEAEAAKIGITKTTLFRARKQLGVKPNKAGFSGGWEWALPEDSNPPEPEVESSEAESSENPAPDAGLRLVEPSQDSTPSTLESSGSEGASPEAIPAADEAEIRAFERRLEEARRASR